MVIGQEFTELPLRFLRSSSVELENRGATVSVSSCPTASYALLCDSDMRGLHNVMVQPVGCCTCGPPCLTLSYSTFRPHRCIYVFCVDLRTNRHYFLYNINWLVFITETESVYCAVRTGYLYIILRSAHTAVFMCFVWISEQTAIISLYNINWLVLSLRRRVFTARYGLGLSI